jgi:putative FmdB family regulatory protein
MPTYDYACDACGHRFEQFQSIKADALVECPKCHEPKLRRLIGAGAGFLFKGGGFYITDYRSENYKSGAKSAEGGTSTPADAAKPSEAKSGGSPPAESKPAESKPAAKPDSKPSSAGPS